MIADWGPVRQTYAGLKEIEPQWVAENLSKVHVVDVRGPEEYNDKLGHIPNAQLMPLNELQQRVDELPTDKPIVTVCQSGRRSGQATVILKKQGVNRVASMRGGMLQWNQANLPTVKD